MPTPAESLTKDSKEDAVVDAISRSIAQLVKEGYDQEQAAAIAYSQAREATGRELRPRGPRRAR